MRRRSGFFALLVGATLTAIAAAQGMPEGVLERARQGDVAAQAALGRMYLEDIDLAADYTRAAEWFRKAADQGDAKAQLYLGFLYTQGRGVPQDYAQAASWFHLAADQAEPEAQFNLGNMYAAGKGVPQDLTRAYMWFELAAKGSQPVAAIKRDMVGAALDEAQIEAAKRLAQAWSEKDPELE